MSYTPRLTDAERRILEEHERSSQWGAIRSAALDAMDAGTEYLYHDGRSVHRCRTMLDVAGATRRERKAARVAWPEDR